MEVDGQGGGQHAGLHRRGRQQGRIKAVGRRNDKRALYVILSVEHCSTMRTMWLNRIAPHCLQSFIKRNVHFFRFDGIVCHLRGIPKNSRPSAH